MEIIIAFVVLAVIGTITLILMPSRRRYYHEDEREQEMDYYEKKALDQASKQPRFKGTGR